MKITPVRPSDTSAGAGNATVKGPLDKMIGND